MSDLPLLYRLRVGWHCWAEAVGGIHGFQTVFEGSSLEFVTTLCGCLFAGQRAINPLPSPPFFSDYILQGKVASAAIKVLFFD